MSDIDLQLPRTRLAWTEDRLTRFTKSDEKMAEFAAEDIQSLEIYCPWDPIVIAINIGSAAIAAAAFQFIPNNSWRLGVTALFGILALLMLLCLKKNRIRISLNDGTNVEIEFTDAPEEVEAFLSSVRSRLGSVNHRAASVSLVA